jgi:predicted  nucleic acid-binding Zn-ribbon protein
MENSTEKNLQLLLELQEIDKHISEIFQLRGGLPHEVKKLEDELSHLESQAKAYQEEIKNSEQNITELRVKIKDIQALAKRYEEQQVNVRNNREYDAITKEIELQRLDIQLAEKKIREHYEHIEKSKQALEELYKLIEKASKNLKTKQEDLNSIIAESQEEEKKLTDKRKKLLASIDKNLLQTYEAIRDRVRNKLAVVMVKGGACEGCFTIIHPQLQAEIKEKRQILKCEHCGRILADVAEVTIITPEEETPIE